MEKEIEIPKGYEARIEGNKVVLERKESSDEWVRERLLSLVRVLDSLFFGGNNPSKEQCLAYLEKQKEQKHAINIEHLKSYMLQYLQDASNREDDSEIEADTDKWAKMIIKVFGGVEQKLTEWSEEDEKIRKWLISYLENKLDDDEFTAGGAQMMHNAIAWLKKTEWGEEDETALDDLMWCIEQAKKSAKDENDMGNIWFAENWINNRVKSLRYQPKQEWSKEDKKIALEYLPRWRKSDLKDKVNLHFKRIEGKTFICYHNRMIALADLKRLPGFYEDTEEVKPVEFNEEDKTNGWEGEDLKRYLSCLQRLGTGNTRQPETMNSKWFKEHCSPQPKREWSERDDKYLASTIAHVADGEYFDNLYDINKYDIIDWLKSLNPQPNINLASSFMNYLDEHRPEGKMCLSNVECKDIDNAFKENDWAKIIRYAKKYSSSWKPSKEQMEVFLKANPVNLMPEELSVYHSLYNDLKKL